MKALKDNERRTIKSKVGSKITVTAFRIDSETSYVIIAGKYSHNVIWLTDADAEDLMVRIKSALSILPTSK